MLPVRKTFVYEMKLLSYFSFPISVQLLYFISIFALNHLSIVTSHFRQDIKQQWYNAGRFAWDGSRNFNMFCQCMFI